MSDTKENHLAQELSNNSAAGPPGEKAPKKRGGIAGHCKRFWWVHLIILVVCKRTHNAHSVYVAYPKIAQDAVNKSRLNLTYQSIKNPTSDSFDINVTTKIINHAMYHPKIYSFNADLYLDGSDTPFTTLPIPAVKANNGALEHISTHSIINNSVAFTEYVTAVVKQENVTIHLKGKTHLRQGALPKIKVNYKQTLTFAGFNGLEGLTVTNISLLSGTQADGANMAGTVNIPNPTVLIQELGNLTMQLSLPASVANSSSDVDIGTSTVNNTVLYPGTNSFPLRSTVNTLYLLGLIQENTTLIQDLPMLISGKNVTRNGEEIPWLSDALGNNTVEVHLNLTSAF
ncbi:hypothetical protein UCRPC4_g06010 [Phaeomoniella chlamydospora]|uniref:Uncharacterized protein n=1 Tax=Phaeomoniella chlamydospora TaxID=158046 RepID=A0A0G2DZX3_PHACM|nr:hypothetical protein UCRPC4_g06010 [Phaeomoniella chlamydospora]